MCSAWRNRASPGTSRSCAVAGTARAIRAAKTGRVAARIEVGFLPDAPNPFKRLHKGMVRRLTGTERSA